MIQDLLMPSTYAAVTALSKDTDAFKYDIECYYNYYYYILHDSLSSITPIYGFVRSSYAYPLGLSNFSML